MKKILAGVLLVSASSLALASGPAGCGAGSLVFPNAGPWYEHVLAATTNGISGNQTFGMTSGTLGCEAANGPLKLAQAFIDENMDQLAADTAMGQGETLAALAEVIGVQAQDSAAFNQTMQAHFDELFSAQGTSTATYEAMKAAMAQDAQLQKYLG
ncbi:MAG: DUF3015 family protein [Venatoribacter sp.]